MQAYRNLQAPTRQHLGKHVVTYNNNKYQTQQHTLQQPPVGKRVRSTLSQASNKIIKQQLEVYSEMC